MDLALMLTAQVCVMFILIILGYVIKKCNIITKDGAKQLSDILLMVVTPCVIIKAYQVDFEAGLIYNLLIAFAAAIVINVVSVVAGKLIFGRKDIQESKINEYCVAYSNCGFMGIPLLEATLGAQGVFYGSTYFTIFNILSWTHGVYLYSGNKKTLSLKNIIINPGVLGVITGLLLFFARIKLPTTVMTAINYTAALNTPLAMILLGVFLADVNLKTALKKVSLYTVSFVRLILVPVLAIFILMAPFIPNEVAVAVLIPAACPSATSSAIFAAKYDLNASYASEIVAINTIMSIATLPMIVALNAVLACFFNT